MVEAKDNSEKTIKGILTKLALIMGFILIVPGIMSNVLDIDPLDGCIKITEREANSAKKANDRIDSGEASPGAEKSTNVTAKECWRNADPGTDKLTKAKIAFDEDVIGLISWGLTAFILIMVVVGFVFPGRDIISYIRSEKDSNEG